MATINQLLTFIRSHQNACYYDESTNKIMIQSEWVNSSNNTQGYEWEAVQPTLKAVRDLLGY